MSNGMWLKVRVLSTHARVGDRGVQAGPRTRDLLLLAVRGGVRSGVLYGCVEECKGY